LKAELQPLPDDIDLANADIRSADGCVETKAHPLRSILDPSALRQYRTALKSRNQTLSIQKRPPGQVAASACNGSRERTDHA
jgi:hypothetical protein